MEFILQQQAQFAAGLDELREQVRLVTSGFGELSRGFGELGRGFGELRQQQAGLHSIVGRLAEQQLQLSTVVLAIAEEQKRLTEAQRHTDERLNALISVVDGIVGRLPRQ